MAGTRAYYEPATADGELCRVRKDGAWEQWVLDLKTKERNRLILDYALTQAEAGDLKKCARRK